MDRNGYPLPVKFATSLAQVIATRRDSHWATRDENEAIPPPGKNWAMSFHKRHPELSAVRLKTIEWERHDHSIYEKCVHWFAVIGPQLADPILRRENIYNMDETGVLLSVLTELKVLVHSAELRKFRGVGTKRTLITAIECFSMDGRVLNPLVIWPAETHRVNWTTFPTPGWRYGLSESGYNNGIISLEWIKGTFNPQTKDRAKGSLRLLIADGFTTHESAEIQRFCYEEGIRLSRLPSHTSHKLQPADITPFSCLKTYYREEVERLYRGGVKLIGKPHFTQLYDKARRRAFTERNIRSGWRRAGLDPFRPEVVLEGMSQPSPLPPLPSPLPPPKLKSSKEIIISTPKTSDNVLTLRKEIENRLVGGGILDTPSRLRIIKLGKAAENAFAERSLLLDENTTLFEQNCEATRRKSTAAKVIGTAKVLGYEDLIAAEEERDRKEVEAEAKRGRRRNKKSVPVSVQVLGKRSRSLELEEEVDKIRASGLNNYCSVLSFS